MSDFHLRRYHPGAALHLDEMIADEASARELVAKARKEERAIYFCLMTNKHGETVCCLFEHPPSASGLKAFCEFLGLTHPNESPTEAIVELHLIGRGRWDMQNRSYWGWGDIPLLPNCPARDRPMDTVHEVQWLTRLTVALLT